jgi:hypothetical protein
MIVELRHQDPGKQVGAGHAAADRPRRAATCTIFSQQRQDFLRRAVSTTFSLAAMKSRISVTSSPTRRRGPPHSGQCSPGSSTMRSRGVAR